MPSPLRGAGSRGGKRHGAHAASQVESDDSKVHCVKLFTRRSVAWHEESPCVGDQAVP